MVDLGIRFLGAAVIGVTLCIANSSNAASVSIVSDSSFNTNDFDVEQGDLNEFDRGLVDVADTTTSGTSYSTTSSASGDGASASGFGSVDIDSGLLRSRTEVTLDAPRSTTGIEAGGATVSTLVTEFTAVGDGWATANLDVDGTWDLGRDDGTPGWQAQASIGRTGTSDFQTFIVNQSNATSSGSVDTTLSLRFFASDGEKYSITSRLLTQILVGSYGVVDFSNTAALTFDLDTGLALDFADPRTLTNIPVTDGTVVPLPSGLPLLFAGLLMLGIVRHRRVRQ